MKKTARAARHVLIIHSSTTFQAGKHINNLQRSNVCSLMRLHQQCGIAYCDWNQNSSLLMKLNIDDISVKLHGKLRKSCIICLLLSLSLVLIRCHF